MKICFFTIANTEFYSHIANTLAFTFRKHTKYNLHVFTQNTELITFGTPHFFGDYWDISSLQSNDKMYKFEFFKKIKNLVDADYYLYIDPNTYLVKSFNYFESVVEKDEMFGLLEIQLSSNTRNTLTATWHDKKLSILNSLFNEFSKNNIIHYTISSSFFGFKKESIDKILDQAYKIKTYLSNKISNLSEEFILSILAGIYIKNTNIHLLKNNFIYYGQDNNNFFQNKIPKNCTWLYKNLTTNETFDINPAIVNCYQNKYILYRFSRDILSRTLIPVETETIKETNLKKFNINFIITCENPYNLPLLIKSIEEQIRKNISYKIFIYFRSNRNDIDKEIINFCILKNNVKIFFNNDLNEKNLETFNVVNHSLDLIKEGWIYELDDNNVLYPNFLEDVIQFINNNPEKECLIFHQENRYQPQNINDIKLGMIEKSMYLINRTFIGNEKIPNFNGSESVFIEKLYNKDSNKILFIDKILCFYNKLTEL